MTGTKTAAGVLLAALLLADSGSARAAVRSEGALNWLRLQNNATHLYLGVLDDRGTLGVEEPSQSGRQDFSLLRARQGYQMHSRLYPGRCVTATDTGRDVRMEECRANDTAQLWDHHRIGEDGSAFASVQFPYDCLVSQGNRNTIVLRLCDESLEQRWHTVS
ncbi:ricin-type beta-trefoil lectin domain protein [Streptomyces sp. NPDC093982]|uniref:ricin-type beta-trefoil lectin domain protein n=1 Tax=Streptomyces sp. NPDC093982 TaxID=3155077 RepID=UPI003434F68E